MARITKEEALKIAEQTHGEKHSIAIELIQAYTRGHSDALDFAMNAVKATGEEDADA